MQCSFGVAPSVFNSLPLPKVMIPLPAGKINDNIPMANVPPFGMCNSPANPMVIALTAAAMGVLTPAPCIPALSAPWITTSPTVLVGGTPAIDANSKMVCNWGGMISFITPGQMTVV
ncbi:MAG: DUF4280 domain-containing protein [Silvanigrellaceae bacterium]|nr:DUF4280 domain-containing protein [Silvanigrellaceae bacterium]